MASLTSEITQGQAAELVARLGRAGLTPDMVKYLNGDDEAVRRFVHEGLASIRGCKSIQLRALIEYNVGCYEDLREQFDEIDERVREVTVVEGVDHEADAYQRYEVEFELLPLTKGMSLVSEISAFARRDVTRFASTPELLGFARTFPDFQRRFKIIAIGTICQLGSEETPVWYPVLDGDLDGRSFKLLPYDVELEGDERMLIVTGKRPV